MGSDTYGNMIVTDCTMANLTIAASSLSAVSSGFAFAISSCLKCWMLESVSCLRDIQELHARE